MITGIESYPRPRRHKNGSSQAPLGQVPLSSGNLQHIDHWMEKLVDFYIGTVYGDKVQQPKDGAPILLECRSGSSKTALLERVSCEWTIHTNIKF